MAQKPKSGPGNVRVLTDSRGADPDSLLWAPQPGPQTLALLAQDFEIFLGGAKGGGKSFCIIGWLMAGNPRIPLTVATALDISYLNCPEYSALVLRRNVRDLDSWIDEAGAVYSKLGAAYTQNPNEFTFPSGAKINMGHMDDERAVEKHFGNKVHRVAIDELTFISSLTTYMKLKSCVRSNVKGIRPQMLLTGNPGGPGHGWVLDRFVEPLNEDGRIIPPGTSIITYGWNPFLKRDVETSRIFIPSKLKDNPKMLETDPLYYNRLMDLPEAQRAAYLDGDWHSLSGPYFSDFRPVRREGEPPEACHVVAAGTHAVHDWLPVVASCDWGFEHHYAVFGAKKDTNGQLVTHREMVGQGVGSVELGNRIARLFLPDLENLKRGGVKPVIHLWLSPDAWGQRDEHKTQAEGIAHGIGEVLGPNAVHLPELHHKIQTDFDDGFFEELKFQEESGIVLRKMQAGPRSRKAGATHMREMLRWRQIQTAPPEEFSPKFHAELQLQSADKAQAYLALFQRRKPEALPKALIEAHCTHLIRSIPALVSDPKDLEDVLKTEDLSDDVYDAWRGLLHSENVMKNREPKQVFTAKHIEMHTRAGQPLSFDDKVWMSQAAAEEYDKDGDEMQPFSVRRPK